MTSDEDLVVRVDAPLPPSLPVGRGTAVFCLGAAFHRREPLRSLELVVDGKRRRPDAWRMPRLDLFQALPAELANSYRSGFWGTVDIEPRSAPGTLEVELEAELESGKRLRAPFGTIAVVEPPPASAAAASAGPIAVCMATFEPDIELFEVQVDSLRAQTDQNWICVISDDCSEESRFEELAKVVADDERFSVSRSPERLGHYRNFERALRMAPSEAGLVALCDHDDRWYPDKLAVLRERIGDSRLVYSDQRLVDRAGRVLRDSLWGTRRRDHSNIASLLVANSVTGSAALLRREVAEDALPFPEVPGWPFHDHWLALVAAAGGDIAYVDRPLYDYVQHGEAVVGKVGTEGEPARTGHLRGWRAAYFYAYVPRRVYAATLLVRFRGALGKRKHRALRLFTGADRNLLAFAWLAGRPLRRLAGRGETLGTEAELARGILWRCLIRARAGRRERPEGSPYDASCPPFDANALGQRRLARWRAGA